MIKLGPGTAQRGAGRAASAPTGDSDIEDYFSHLKGLFPDPLRAMTATADFLPKSNRIYLFSHNLLDIDRLYSWTLETIRIPRVQVSVLLNW